MTRVGRSGRQQRVAEWSFNNVVTRVPSHVFRQGFLRLFGAKIGRDTSIMMGSRVIQPSLLRVGANCSIGFDVMLDARGGLTIDDDVVLASDVFITTAGHRIDGEAPVLEFGPVHVKHHAWLTSRATVLRNVTIGVGAVVGACSLVEADVADMAIVAGNPAVVRGSRRSALTYHPLFRPLLY